MTTLVRGERVWDGGELCAPTGHRRFLPCGKPEMARPKAVEPVATAGDYMGNRPTRWPGWCSNKMGPQRMLELDALDAAGSPPRAPQERSTRATW